jgi:hypothetical protein
LARRLDSGLGRSLHLIAVGGSDEIEGVENFDGAGDTDRLEDVDLMEEVEVLDAIPVLASEPSRAIVGSLTPAVRTVAVAAGGFVAGAVVVGLLHQRGRRASASSRRDRMGRAPSRGARGGRDVSRAVELVQIVGTRSLLVDVHLLGGRGER